VRGTAGKHGGINLKAYDTAREDDPTIVEILVEEYFADAVWYEDEGAWRCGDRTGAAGTGKGSFQIGVIAESVPIRTLRLRHDPAVGFHGRALSGRTRFRGQPWWATVRPQPVIERLQAFPGGGKAVPDGCLWQRSEIRPAKVCTVSGTHLAGNTSASMANKSPPSEPL
jgi:hypothetical protein